MGSSQQSANYSTANPTEGGGDQPVFGVKTMEQIVSDSVAGRRFSMLLLGVFAGLALVLAAVGMYGVISYTATQRPRRRAASDNKL